ncbi:XYLK-like protein [Mya arenaria]|uniref:XYLK-like protein n=1 Tax=Mya arenaria TaxID=6604 RepID=A0ABY7G895_MYAAR|nr:XYLK-like protein [Mya arenaria]
MRINGRLALLRTVHGLLLCMIIRIAQLYPVHKAGISDQHLESFLPFLAEQNNYQGKDWRNITLFREELVKSLTSRYKIDWGCRLNKSPWSVAEKWLSNQTIIPERTPELGTQLKLLLKLKGGQKVAFKPKRFSRDAIIQGPPYAGEDRHNGEIVAFHLSRLLEFRRTPLAAGRVINLETEIKPGESTGVCGEGALLEGSLILWLPEGVSLTQHKHPWARTYKTGLLAHYHWGPRLLDIIDTAILDFLMGNADRHRYETYRDTMLMLDNAKSFGNPQHDETSILAPLYHCCRTEYWVVFYGKFSGETLYLRCYPIYIYVPWIED